MALIIEDGTEVANANSFVDVTAARAYADLRGLELPADDTELEQLLIKAMDYIFSREDELQGCRITATQTMPYPREGDIKINGIDLNDLTTDPENPVYNVPKQIKDAQSQLAIEQHAGVPLYPSPITSATSSEGQVIEETVGPLTVKYSDKSTAETVKVASDRRGIVIASVETLLKPLFGRGNFLGTIRA